MRMNMFSLIFKKFKILYLVINFIMVNVVYYFISFELAANMLFHNITMLEDSFTINIYPYVPKFCKTRNTFFQNFPIWRDIIKISTRAPKSSKMHTTNTSSFSTDFFDTIFNSTNIAFHI